MGTYRLLRRAEADLADIVEYTVRTWGVEQAARYIDDLESCCEMLANRPRLGRLRDEFRPGLRRMERGRRVVFYRQDSRGITISRFLHQRMLPTRHMLDDQE